MKYIVLILVSLSLDLFGQSDFSRDSSVVTQITEIDSVTTVQVSKVFPTVRDAMEFMQEQRVSELEAMREQLLEIKRERRRLNALEARLQRMIARYETRLGK
jgi:hypothetical protein